MRRLLGPVLMIGVSAIASAASSPDVVWQVPAPNSLSNSVLAVGWSPVADAVAVGSTDRWLRARRSTDGVQSYSALEPQHSNGVGQSSSRGTVGSSASRIARAR